MIQIATPRMSVETTRCVAVKAAAPGRENASCPMIRKTFQRHIPVKNMSDIFCPGRIY
ncbi:hypothetical protein GCM10007924_00830 [Sneathiella chinensis]|uniref:Uncharacterized protein n=1 Tax=Sneathiella chinensis TaxID=349750 RepID=A0ABQ5TY92_9PROT|nr:hypothetical protein GCM10007924_00830 [Sneathiella chinensis]